jgi:hypothetical protein
MVAPIAITVTVLVPEATVGLLPLKSLVTFPGLVLSPRLLPRIRLLRLESTLPAKLLIPLPSIVVTMSGIAIAWRTELNAHSKLLRIRLRWSSQH